MVKNFSDLIFPKLALTRVIRIGKQMKFKRFSAYWNRNSQAMQGSAKLWLFLILNGKSAVFESQSGKFEFTENGEIFGHIKISCIYYFSNLRCTKQDRNQSIYNKTTYI